MRACVRACICALFWWVVCFYGLNSTVLACVRQRAARSTRVSVACVYACVILVCCEAEAARNGHRRYSPPATVRCRVRPSMPMMRACILPIHQSCQHHAACRHASSLPARKQSSLPARNTLFARARNHLFARARNNRFARARNNPLCPLAKTSLPVSVRIMHARLHGDDARAGLPPFFDNNRQIMFRKILQAPLFKPRVMSEDAFTLITGMLNRNPKQRLGCGGD